MTLPASLDGRSSRYRQWRDTRLHALQQQTLANDVISLVVSPSDSANTGRDSPLHQISQRVQTHGYCRYRLDVPEPFALDALRHEVKSLAIDLGLQRADRGVLVDDTELALLQDHTDGPLGRFRPYSNALLNWHTDGYYNGADAAVRTFILHCVNQANAGGALTILDPQLVLIRLYADAPEVATLLSAPDALTLPANKDAEGHDRPDRTVPVFFAHPDETLGMRFTTRTRNIRFKDSLVASAMDTVTSMIHDCSDLHQTVRLQPGEGLIARNILHTRSAFSDRTGQHPRQILRGRYLDPLTVRKTSCCM